MINRKLTIAIVIAGILISTIFLHSETWLVVAADSFGNDINFIEVWQWNGTGYILKANFTSTDQSVRVHDGDAIKFVVSIKFNSTFADSTAEAIEFTRIHMNITDGGTIWNNEELNNTSCSLVGSFYMLQEEGVWNNTGYPAAGVVYTCNVLYQGYY